MSVLRKLAVIVRIFFFFNDTATTEIYTLSLHDALPICVPAHAAADVRWDGPIHPLAERGDPVDAHERRDRNLGLAPGVLSHEAREPSVLALVEREKLDERRTGVKRLIVGNGARDLAGSRIAELRGLL